MASPQYSGVYPGLANEILVPFHNYLSSTYNAADFLPLAISQGNGSKENAIQLAINQAAVAGIKYVYIPANMLPYTASLVTFNANVKMTREGGNPAVFDVWAYGAAHNGVGGGGTDDAAAIQAAVNAASVGGVPAPGVVYFPGGQYRINSSITLNGVTDVFLVGEANNASVIAAGATGVTCLNFTGVCSRVTIRDLWLGSFTAWAAGGGISVVGTAGTHSDSFIIENVTIQNVPTPALFSFMDNSYLRNIKFIQSIASATVSPVVQFSTCITVFCTSLFNVVTAGTLPSHVYVIDFDCDTIVFIASTALNAGGGGHGFRFLKSAGTTGPRLSRCLNCYSESNAGAGFSIEEGRDVRLQGCHAAVNTGAGYQINGGTSITLHDCFALQNGTQGYIVNAGAGVGIIGCTASNNSQTTTNTYDGILVGDGLTHVRLIGNRSGDFVFTLANKQRYGIILNGAGVDYCECVGNDCTGNQSGDYFSLSTQIHNQLIDYRTTGVAIGADVGDAAKTLTIGVDEEVQVWNTPLTAGRTVTLSTARTWNGARFRIVRTAAATGAFNLTVLTKGLTAGQWVDVQLQAGTWIETGFGSL